MRKQFLWLLAIFGILASMVRPLLAQVVVEAVVDRNQMTTDEILLFTIQVNARPDVAPNLPPLNGFRVVGTSSASQISIVNGQTTASFAYRFQLQPQEAGTFTIESIDVVIDGQRYQTNALSVTVGQGSNPLPSEQGAQIVPPTELDGQDFYVEAEVDNPIPYIGEQISYIFRFYQSLEMLGRPSYAAPDFVGFWDRREQDQTQTLSNIGNRTYRITSLNTPLFPTIAGERVVDSAEFSLPDNRVLLTEPIILSIKPLPDPAPENFSGAVGQYVADAVVDKTTVAVGEAVTWRVAVGGFGNIDTLPEPTWPEIDGWRMFEEQSTVNTEFANGIVQGRRVYDRILIPSEVGEFVLPGIEYGYFNPESEQYETVTTEAVTFVVVEGEAVEESADSAEPILLNEISPLRQAPKKLRQPFSLIDKPLFWALWLMPLLGLVINRGLHWRNAKRESRLTEKQKRNAFRIAQQAIKVARSENINLADKQAERIMTSYLSDKFDESFVGLSQIARAQKLRTHGIRETLIRWTNRLYDQAEGTRYGYSGNEAGKLLAEVEQVIGRFERGEQGGLI